MNQEHNREKREAVAMFTWVRSTLRRIAVSALLLSATFGASAQVRYVHTDGLGSVVVMTDQNRNVIERREYEPYGSTLAPAKDGPGFTGHVSDAQTGLTYMQQRYYDPSIGRFLSVDPVTALEDPVTQFNRYRYANNNPYKFTDPDGRRVAGGCTTNCTSVQINYVKVPGAPGYVHAYIIVVPKDGSASQVVRAGPTGGRSVGGNIQAASPPVAEMLGIKPDSRKLQAITSTLANAPDAQGSQAGSQTIVQTSASGGEVMKQLTHFRDAVNAAGVNYDARGVNSNSFAFDAAQGLTGARPAATPDSGNNALGSDRTTGVQFEPQEPNH